MKEKNVKAESKIPRLDSANNTLTINDKISKTLRDLKTIMDQLSVEYQKHERNKDVTKNY